MIHSNPVSNVFMLAFKMSEETHCNVFRLFNQCQMRRVIVHLSVSTHICTVFGRSELLAPFTDNEQKWIAHATSAVFSLQILHAFKHKIFLRCVFFFKKTYLQNPCFNSIGTITSNTCVLWRSVFSGEKNSCRTCWWCSRPKVWLWLLVVSLIPGGFLKKFMKSILYAPLAANSHLSVMFWKLFVSPPPSPPMLMNDDVILHVQEFLKIFF